jgi:hypothetical protein
MDAFVKFEDLVPGTTYLIGSDKRRGDMGYDAMMPYKGIFVSKSANGMRATFRNVKDKDGGDQGGLEFNYRNFYYADLVPDVPIVEVSIDAKKSELEEDIFTGDELKQGDRVIRIGGKNNWIYNREELEKWWKKNPNTNPLVSGNKEYPASTKVEYGTLNILPEGGRRRTKKSKRRHRKTRRSHK